MITDWIFQPWPWHVSGAAIAAVMLILLYLGKSFGFSENFRTICAAAGAGKNCHFFRIDIKAQRWNILFLLGTLFGGYLAAEFRVNDDHRVAISENTIASLTEVGIEHGDSYLPESLFGPESLQSPKGLAILIIGGLLVGFGTRYAGGCTSGHAISGLANLQLPSLLAVIGFFAGGLFMVHVLFPLIF